jgi:hypothetical protein
MPSMPSMRTFPSMPKMSKLFIPRNSLKYILYFVTLSIAINFIMNKQIMALLSLFIIAGLVYYINKNEMMALLISIIVTNLLLALQYLDIQYKEPLLKTTKTGQHISQAPEMFV